MLVGAVNEVFYRVKPSHGPWLTPTWHSQNIQNPENCKYAIYVCYIYDSIHKFREHSENMMSPTGPDYTFPEPRLENVYRAWKPIDYGHPLVDATIHYAPPELERVRKPMSFLNMFCLCSSVSNTVLIMSHSCQPPRPGPPRPWRSHPYSSDPGRKLQETSL